jgi:hypothetical protein
MRIKNKQTYIIVLPHHDDEIFLVQFLHSLRFRHPEPYELIFFYATYDNESPARIFENWKYLARIVKHNYSIINFGKHAEVTPRGLIAHLDRFESELLDLINSLSSKVTLVFPLLEFGHIDHDVMSLICLRVQDTKITEKIGYSTYRLDQFLDRLPYFHVATIRIPLIKKLALSHRVQIFLDLIRGFLAYKSQRPTWIKLGAILIIRAWFSNSQNWQTLNENEYSPTQLLRQDELIVFPIDFKYFPRWSTRNYLE